MSQVAVDRFAVELGRALAARGWCCATAESCTGGLVAGAITDVAGSSDWFDRGFVTYSNEAKTELLGVAAETLARYGAVSEATAQAMVEGALAASRANLAVAVTGIAGPGGGSTGKPVGTVCFAWMRRGETAITVTRLFTGDRRAVRRAAVAEALAGMLARTEGRTTLQAQSPAPTD